MSMGKVKSVAMFSISVLAVYAVAKFAARRLPLPNVVRDVLPS